jgi:hypothetical protein
LFLQAVLQLQLLQALLELSLSRWNEGAMNHKEAAAEQK